MRTRLLSGLLALAATLQAQAQPRLGICPGTNALLQWPINRRGFALEASSGLGAPASGWQVLTGNVSVMDRSYSVAVVPTNAARCFRLRSPATPAQSVESVHFGFNVSYPAMTDDLRLSERTGVNWWSLNTTRQNPENGANIPYAYHDGYVEWIGATNTPTRTPADAALRWWKILNGQGDPWTGATAPPVGRPAIILLDEITTTFTDSQQGPALEEALRLYLTSYGGSRDDILAFLQRSATLSTTPSAYSRVIYCANNYLRCLTLETFCSHQGFITGSDPDGSVGLTDDAYLASRLAMPIKRWADAGVSTNRLATMLAVSTFAGYGGYAKPFSKFLNRQFWFLANGWYNSGHTAVDARIQAALRNGVGSYSFTPGTTVWQLTNTETNRDLYQERYLRWYCVDGHLDANADGVDAR